MGAFSSVSFESLPDMPTLEEQGIDAEWQQWLGIIIL